MITAGPTYESIDPVRFIGNHSSGKMGFELAKQAAGMGAHVVLIAGPSHQTCEGFSIRRIEVTSVQKMYDAVFQYYDQMLVVIAAAAVADYKPAEVASQKIKKSEDQLTLTLVKNPDILAAMGKVKKHQILVGFALETEHELENALGKLKKKNLDAIVLNSLQDVGAGFQSDTNKVTFIDRSENKTTFALQSKKEVAKDIINQIITIYHV